MNLKARACINTALCALVVVAACTVIFFFNPSEVDWMPRCMFHTVTGLQCPTCGATRATHALLHGRFAEALAFNPLGPVIYALAAVILFRIVIRKKTTDKTTLLLIYIFAAVYILWGVTRNIIGV